MRRSMQQYYSADQGWEKGKPNCRQRNAPIRQPVPMSINASLLSVVLLNEIGVPESGITCPNIR